MTRHTPDFTVAICTWNRAGLLRRTLHSLTELQVPHDVTWEVLVVNNNCTDDTDDVVREFVPRLPVRLVYEPVAGLSNARNRALVESAPRVIVFTDDDVQVSPGWLLAIVAASRQFPDAAAFGGPVSPWFVAPPDPAIVEAFPMVADGFCGLDHERSLGPLPEPYRLVGANMAFRRDAIGPLRFDPDLGVNQHSLGGGEEEAFVRSLRGRGGVVVWVPEMRVAHYVDPSRLELDYLIRFTRDRGRASVREHGIPPGRRIAGAPLRMWLRFARAALGAAAASFTQPPARAAARRAKAESYRARIAECRALSRKQ